MFHSDVLRCMHRDDKRRPGTGDVFVSAGWAKPNEALNGEFDHANDILHSTTTCGERSQTRMPQTARLFNLNFPKTSNSFCFFTVVSTVFLPILSRSLDCQATAIWKMTRHKVCAFSLKSTSYIELKVGQNVLRRLSQ